MVVGGKVFDYQVQASSRGQLTIVVNGQIRQVEYAVERNLVHLFDSCGDKVGFRFASEERRQEKAEGKGQDELKAPMPGTVNKVYRKVGDVVKKGEAIVAMEAMKMELVMRADFACKVVKVLVKEGQFVEAGQIMVEVEPVK